MAKQWIDNETAIMAEDMNRLENQVQISTNEPEYKGDLWIADNFNLYDISKIEYGYFNASGGVESVLPWYHEFVEVIPNQTYLISGNIINDGAHIIGFDRDKNFTQYFGTNGPIELTTGNNTYYVGINVVGDKNNASYDADKIMFTKKNNLNNSTQIQVLSDGKYKKITDTVNIGLNNNNAGLWVEVSENLYHKECIINNSTIDGEGRIVNFEGYNIFIIKVDGGKTYTMSNGTVRNYLYGFYREMPGISSIGSGRIIRENILNETFIVPNGYKYLAIRCELNEGEIPNLMLNYGNGPLPYKQNVIPNIKANINGDYISVNNYNNEVILYNNNSGGTLDNIILGDNVENYEYLEIYFRSADGIDNYIKISNPHDKLCALNVMDLRPGDDNYTIIRSRFIHIINNQIYNDNIAGIVKTGYAVVRAGGGTYTVEENQICITKVVGIK